MKITLELLNANRFDTRIVFGNDARFVGCTCTVQ